MGKVGYSKRSIFLIVFVSVVVVALAVFLNVNYQETGTSISGAALTYGSAAASSMSTAPGGQYLDNPNRDDFEKGNGDIFWTFSDGTPIGDRMGGTDAIHIKTGTVNDAGTDANVKFWKDQKANRFCLLLEDNGSRKPGWYPATVKRCLNGQRAYGCVSWSVQVSINLWLEPGRNTIVCWS